MLVAQIETVESITIPHIGRLPRAVGRILALGLASQDGGDIRHPDLAARHLGQMVGGVRELLPASHWLIAGEHWRLARVRCIGDRPALGGGIRTGEEHGLFQRVPAAPDQHGYVTVRLPQSTHRIPRLRQRGKRLRQCPGIGVVAIHRHEEVRFWSGQTG